MITEQELKDYGYTPMNCKIGVLWFCKGKEQFFGKFNSDDEFVFYYTALDTVPQGKVNSIQELKSLEKRYYAERLALYKFYVDEIENVLNTSYADVE